MKQETLEEVALRLYPENWESIMDGQHDSNSYERNALIKGYKLAQEQNKNKYSEEDMEISFEAGRIYEEFIQSQKANLDWEGKIDYKPKSFIEWFEKFKKK